MENWEELAKGLDRVMAAMARDQMERLERQDRERQASHLLRRLQEGDPTAEGELAIPDAAGSDTGLSAVRLLDRLDELTLEAADEGQSDWELAERVTGWMLAAVESFAASRDRQRARELRLIGMPLADQVDILDGGPAEPFLRRDHETAGMVNHAGVRHAKAGALDVAMRFFGAGMLICPAHPEPLSNLGRAHLIAGDQERAFAFYERAHALEPFQQSWVKVFREYGRVPRFVQVAEYRRQKSRPDESEGAALRSALKAVEAGEQALSRQDFSGATEQWESANRTLEKARLFDHANACTLALGDVCFAKGDLPGALELYETTCRQARPILDTFAEILGLERAGDIHALQGDAEVWIVYHQRATRLRGGQAAKARPLAERIAEDNPFVRLRASAA